jgi:hypothetical protein
MISILLVHQTGACGPGRNAIDNFLGRHLGHHFMIGYVITLFDTFTLNLYGVLIKQAGENGLSKPYSGQVRQSMYLLYTMWQRFALTCMSALFCSQGIPLPRLDPVRPMDFTENSVRQCMQIASTLIQYTANTNTGVPS